VNGEVALTIAVPKEDQGLWSGMPVPLILAVRPRNEVDMERHLESEGRVAARFEVVRETLLTEPARVLASGQVAARATRFPVELRFETEGGTAAAQAVMVEIGVPQAGGDAQFPLSWQPAAHTKLLPSFRGTLVAEPAGEDTCLRISGSYRPPLGQLGAFGDGLIGHRLARRTLDSLVGFVAKQLGDDARQRSESVRLRPAPYPESLLDRQPADT
jgi:hypothetical protein